MGRGATVNGNGRPVYPPGVHTPMRRYRQPEPPRRNAWQMVRAVVLWVVLASVVVAGGAAGAAYLKTHQFLQAIAPKTKVDRAAAKRLDLAIPGQPTIALVIGTDRRKGSQAELTGRSDTLILVRADPGTNSLSMLSFPRDLIATVKCPGPRTTTDQRSVLAVWALGAVETVPYCGRCFRDRQLPRLHGSRQQARRRLARHRSSLSLRCEQLSGGVEDQPVAGISARECHERPGLCAIPPLRLGPLPQRSSAVVPQSDEVPDLFPARPGHRPQDHDRRREERRRWSRRRQGARSEHLEGLPLLRSWASLRPCLPVQDRGHYRWQ